MFWLEKIIERIQAALPDGEIIVSSGVSPSGKYHVGTLREVLTADAVARGLRYLGRDVRHIHFVDDLDPFRKIPAGIPESYEQYLGRPLCDIPAPDGSDQSYADYYLADFVQNMDALGIDIEVIRSHEQYRSGAFADVIEQTLTRIEATKTALQEISGRELDDSWSPIQINEAGYLKKRRFVSLDLQTKQLTYLDARDEEAQISYAEGDVKLDWRLDWPARWSMYHVAVEPFGRDHATKGGSYDTGQVLVRRVFDAEPPLPIPYHFINRAGETKKMSKSSGNTVTISELLEVLPPEIVRYFVLRMPPERQLFFDQAEGLMRLIDEYAELLDKPEKDSSDEWLLRVSAGGETQRVISAVPFSHLVASYQAALQDEDRTLAIIKRTEHAESVEQQTDIIKRELTYIRRWLERWAPDSVKFSLSEEKPDPSAYSDTERQLFERIADRMNTAPEDADGQWFHEAIYACREELGLTPQQLFQPLYKLLIGKTAGPRAGWFLSILPRDWLTDRLRFLK